jgi:hypothetical protein
MTYRGLFALLLIIVLCSDSCRVDKAHDSNISTKDSILKEYISKVDSLPYYDTSSIEFRLLKAYSANDTAGLRKILDRFREDNSEIEWEKKEDSCVHQPEFRDIVADEKYRLDYTPPLCPFTSSTTIVRYHDSTILTTVVYEAAWEKKPCRVLDQSTVLIDESRWEEFQESLVAADFWGLKPHNGFSCNDGNTLEVYGFKKGTNREWDLDMSSHILRKGTRTSPIYKSLDLLLKISKTRNKCMAPF